MAGFGCSPRFDAGKVDKLLRQVALVDILALNTQAKWIEVDANALNLIYSLKTVLTFGQSAKPGFLELTLPHGTNLRAQTDARTLALWKCFMQAFAKSPADAKKYFDNQVLSLNRNLKELGRLRLEARQINEQVDQLLQQALFWSYTTKFTAEIAMNILGLVPGAGLVGFLVRTSVGLGYPVAVELINNWDNASVGSISILAFLGAVKTNISSILTEDTTMAKAQLKLVNAPVDKAKDAVRQARATAKELRAQGKSGNYALKQAKAQVPVVKAKSASRAGGLKTFGVALTGVSCYFAYTGSVQSGVDYQTALDNL